MAAGNSPIFVATPRASFVQTSASAVTSTDGTDANVKTVFTAGSNGSKIEDVYITQSATNVATIVRFWINNGSTASTATNNSLVHEETMAAHTLDQVTANPATVIYRPNIVLPAGYKLLVASGTATTALNVTAVGGDY